MSVSTYYFDIAAKAVSLRERIEEPQRFSFQETGSGQYEKRLADWQKAVASDEPGRFQTRLTQDGLTDADLKRLLGSVTISGENNLPDWIFAFEELMSFLAKYDYRDQSINIKKIFGAGYESEIPFLHLLTPIVIYANTKLDQTAIEQVEDFFTLEAQRMLNLEFANLLASFTSPTFLLEFSVYKATQQTSLFRLFEPVTTGAETERGLYAGFCDKIMENGWQSFFQEYAVLAKTITFLTGNRIKNTNDFLVRIARDRSEITAQFGGGILPGKIIKYRGGLSDPHNGGKGVSFVIFESGLKLIYKPKNLELEVAWSELLEWINEKGLTPNLKPVDVLQKGSYGWVGFVAQAPCLSESEVADYYMRIGSLIGLIYLLNGNDFHLENMIASGSHPMLIDLESVMHHEIKVPANQWMVGALLIANDRIESSVLRTGLLPSWTSGKEGLTFDISGIGGYELGVSIYQHPRWAFVNTDRMRVEMVRVPMKDKQNIPVFQEQQQVPTKFTAEIIAGFTSLYQLLIQYRDDIPVCLFAEKDLRFIFRATRIYGQMGRNLTSPEFMREGLDRSIRLELLCRPFLNNEGPDPYWGICKSEISQMEQVDIPIFNAKSDQINLVDSQGTVCSSFVEKSAYDQVLRKIGSMSEEDLAMQVGFIRASLLLRDIGDDVRSNLQRIQPAVNHEDLPDTTDELLAVALDAARSLHSKAIFAADGSCTWISPALIPGTNRFRMQPMSLNLFDGLAGVSLFLSALAKKTNESFVHDLNSATLRTITHWSENLEKNELKDGDAGNEIPVSLPEGFGDEIFNPGLFQGVSGIGYAALHKAFPDEFTAVS